MPLLAALLAPAPPPTHRRLHSAHGPQSQPAPETAGTAPLESVITCRAEL